MRATVRGQSKAPRSGMEVPDCGSGRSTLAERGLLDYDTVDALWTAHRGGANWGMQLWNLLNVSAWHDYWIAGRDDVWPVASAA